ncbi:hypothetical protein QIS99_31445 [Streptomyces sp. B-S-A8]|uniref:Uncharacterized protein n=1 Tax=Streptomyces solicavernae TaxID=3043614 RepID=A0ABT6S1V4_9ACTN|nr:hypothetical protein [Streptomyces sp. B-S-A8]MDI3390676.1 hypothetical protein [Streptomyces sp. B-S-A8]
MDDATRRKRLRAEAERYGASPVGIERAVELIAAVQERDRADYRANFGGELTLDQWLDGYGTDGLDQLLAYAAEKAGLDQHDSDAMRRIVTSAALGEQRDTAAEEDDDQEGFIIGDHPEHGWIVDGPYDNSVAAVLDLFGFVYDAALGTHHIPDGVDPIGALHRVVPALQELGANFVILGGQAAAEAACASEDDDH